MNYEHKEDKIPLLILAGPTAVGKSALALNLARKLNTDIISADSAQVYRGLDIGTAKPSLEEQRMVKHHLIDIVDPDQSYSAADFQKSADMIIEKLWKMGKLPFMVGGTGLYIKAVTDRYAFGPRGANSAIRAAFEEQINREGLEQLYNRLKTVDPQAAIKIHPRDRKRIIRALEVYELEGKPISGQEARTDRFDSPYRPIFYALHMERDALYEKIEERVEIMFKNGFLGEVQNLLNQGYNLDCPGLQILGYRQLLSYLQGIMTWEETAAEIKKQTRNYAKRQLTWFRREKEIEWIEITNMSSLNDIAENILLKVKEMTS